MKNKIFGTKAKVCFLLVAMFLMSQCAKQADVSNLPLDIRGIKLDMAKDDARKQLETIATFQSKAAKGKEVWTLKDDPNYSFLILGYDKEDKVKHVTATLDKNALKERKRVKFSDIGDVSAATKESVQNINKYIWDVAAADGIPEHQVYTYGEDEENLLHLSLAKKMDKEEE